MSNKAKILIIVAIVVALVVGIVIGKATTTQNTDSLMRLEKIQIEVVELKKVINVYKNTISDIMDIINSEVPVVE